MLKEVRRMKDMKLYIFCFAIFPPGLAMMIFCGNIVNAKDVISGSMDGIGIACVVVTAYLFGQCIPSLKKTRRNEQKCRR